jgi:hypothetical protein
VFAKLGLHDRLQLALRLSGRRHAHSVTPEV